LANGEWRLAIDGLTSDECRSTQRRLLIGIANLQSPIVPIINRHSSDRRSTIINPSIGNRHSPIANELRP